MSAVPQAHLDRLYAETDDPWNFRTSAYEQEKFRATRDAVSFRQWAAGLELGCGNGELARGLAPLCDRYVGVDAVPRAVAAARRAVPTARFHEGVLPDALTGPCAGEDLASGDGPGAPRAGGAGAGPMVGPADMAVPVRREADPGDPPDGAPPRPGNVANPAPSNASLAPDARTDGRPDPFGGDDFDLIVLSEVLYFLDRSAIARLARIIERRWPAAALLTVTWLGDSGHDLQGPEALAAFTDATRGPWANVRKAEGYRIDLRHPADHRGDR